jgi:hypothetical protein
MMRSALGLTLLGCGATGSPVDAARAPAPGPSATLADHAPTTTATAQAAATTPPPEMALGKLPKGAVTAMLTLSSPVEPIFGLTVALVGRTHKELAGPPPEVVGIWTVAISRNGKTITSGFTGDSLQLEGTGLGVTWMVDGPYDEERVTVWPGETAPLSEDEAVALARRELTASGVAVSGAVRARVTTTQGGVAQISFGTKPLVARVRVGLYSKRMTTLEPEG